MGSAWPVCVKPTFEVPETACKTCSRHIYAYMHSCIRGQFLFSYYRLHCKVGFPSSGKMVATSTQATFWYTSHCEKSESPVRSVCTQSITSGRRLTLPHGGCFPFSTHKQAWGRHCQTTVPCIKPYIPCIKT